MQILHLHIRAQVLTIPIFIENQFRKNLKTYLHQNLSNHSIFVVSDSNVAQIYSKQIYSEIGAIPGFKDILIFPAGEESKSRYEKGQLEDQLLKHKIGRDTVLIAFGGGVTGDLSGFVAATLHRGIPLIHVPTTLLAQVDSSIGGKVGINHLEGKNLIGAFYQPNAIFVNIRFLQTLPQDEFINGLAEVIKYCVILDNDLWDFIENNNKRILQRNVGVLEVLIKRCIQLKLSVVEQDEKEAGYRSILNFGHSVGHAVEKLSHYKIKHGQAISIGMIIASRLSHRLLGFSKDQIIRLERTLELFGLNLSTQNNFSFDKIWETIISDKKSRQKSPRFTLLNNSSKPELFYPVKKEDLRHALSKA
jgi:3-dehydroquinate synthase